MSTLKINMPRAFRAVIIGLAAVLLNACAALWNPHVKPVTKDALIDAYYACDSINKRPCRPKVADETLPFCTNITMTTGCRPRISEQDKCEAKFDPDICEAINYAERWRQAYYVAIGDHSKLRSVVASLSIPLSAIALYDGITKTGSTKQVARFAVAGAAAYTAGAFYSGSPQQKVYIGGAQALTCALFQVRPYLIQKTNGSDGANILIDQLTETARQMRILQGDLNSTSLATTDTDYIKAQRALSHAQNIHAQAWQVRNDFHDAGYTLRNRVDLITETVSQQMIDNEPSLDKLLTLLGTMKANAGSIGQGALAASSAGADIDTATPPAGGPAPAASGSATATNETGEAVTALSEIQSKGLADESGNSTDKNLALKTNDGNMLSIAAKDYDFTKVYPSKTLSEGSKNLVAAKDLFVNPKNGIAKPAISIKSITGKNLVFRVERKIQVPKSTGLATDTDKLLSAASNLAAAVAEYDGIRNAVSNISACRPGTVDSGFSVTPAEPTATVARGNTITFVVTNKVNTPSTSFSGPNADASHVMATTTLTDGKFNVVVTGVDTTGVDAPTLNITDGTGGNSTAIKITVTGADSKTTGAAAETKATLKTTH